jgi:1,4-dihydroxy-2-naphthoate octaprenyltransferase
MTQFDAARWRERSWWARMAGIVRAPVLIMTLGSAGFGGALAMRAGPVDAWAFGLVIVGLLLAHITNNLLNDFVDYRRGIDSADYYRVQYGVHALAHGLLTPAAFGAAIAVAGGAAAVCAGALLLDRGPVLLVPVLLGSVALLAYTWPLKQWALGELTVLIVWGPLMVGGTFAALTGVWSWPVASAGLVLALGPTAVILAKHIDKRQMDAGKGVRTLPVVLGDVRARALTRAVLLLHLPALFALAAVGVLPWAVLLVLLSWRSLVSCYSVLRAPAPAVRPADFPAGVWPLWQVAFVFRHVRSATLLLLLGFVLAGF